MLILVLGLWLVLVLGFWLVLGFLWRVVVLEVYVVLKVLMLWMFVMGLIEIVLSIEELEGVIKKMVCLVMGLIWMCVIFLGKSEFSYRKVGWLLITEVILIRLFISVDMISFFVCFEGVLILMFFMMVKEGRDRKKKAVKYLVLYTLIGSIGMILGIIIMYSKIGSCSDIVLFLVKEKIEGVVFWCWFLGLMVKVLMILGHLWLAEAHVEAQTVGSVVLGGLILKLGGFGMLKYMVILMETEWMVKREIIGVWSVLGVLIGSMIGLRQIDVKKVIAYGSIVHMNVMILGLCSLEEVSIEGSIVSMIAHGIVTGGMFLCIGIVYKRKHTRLIKDWSGLVEVMLLWSILMCLFMFSNMSVLGTVTFVGEIKMFMGIVSWNIGIGLVVLVLSVLVSAGTGFYMLNRILYGVLRMEGSLLREISLREFMSIFLLVWCILVLGV